MAKNERTSTFSARDVIADLNLLGSNKLAQATGDLVIGQLDNGISANDILTSAGVAGVINSITGSGQSPTAGVVLGSNNVGISQGSNSGQAHDADGVVDTTAEGLDGDALFNIGSDVVSAGENVDGNGAVGSVTPNAGQNRLIGQIAAALGPQSVDVNSGDNSGRGPGSIGNIDLGLPTGNTNIALGLGSITSGQGQGTTKPNDGSNPDNGNNGQSAPSDNGNGRSNNQAPGNSPNDGTNGPANQNGSGSGNGPQNNGGPPNNNANPNDGTGPANSGTGSGSSSPPPSDSQPQNAQPPNPGNTNGNPSNTPPSNTGNNANGAGSPSSPNSGSNGSGNGNNNAPGNEAGPGDNNGDIVSVNIGGPNGATGNGSGGVVGSDILDGALSVGTGSADTAGDIVVTQ